VTTWSYNGTALTEFGIVRVFDDYLDSPERRGENIQIPYRDGRVHVAKFWDERKIAISIAIYGADAQALETKIDSLNALVSPRSPKALVQTREDSSVRTAQATVDASRQPERFSHYGAKAVLVFTLADPFFRSDTEVDETETIDESPKAMAVENTGNVEERNPTIILTGPLENVVITNTENGCSLLYTGEIDDGDTVTIQQAASGEYTAVHSVDGDVIGNVSHDGETALMVLIAGDNDLSIESDVETTGTVQITFYPPYI
jgi:phage-related protein